MLRAVRRATLAKRMFLQFQVGGVVHQVAFTLFTT
jgi:hypothetical protein